MARAFSHDRLQDMVDRAANEFSVTTDVAEVANVIVQARTTGNPSIWNQIITFVENNPYSTESEIAAGTVGSNPDNDRQILILLIVLDAIDQVVVV